MQVVMASNSSLVPLHSHRVIDGVPRRRRLMGRRELCFDGISSVSRSETHSDDSLTDPVSPHPNSTQRYNLSYYKPHTFQFFT